MLRYPSPLLLRLTREQYAALAAEAKLLRTSMAQVARQALTRYLASVR
jgi:hypothetical protein